jgi:hypothetical protein
MGRRLPEGLEPLLHAEGCNPRPMQKYYHMSCFTEIKGVVVGVGEVRVNMRGGTPNTHPAAQTAKVLQRGYHFCFIFIRSISLGKGNFLKNTTVTNFK